MENQKHLFQLDPDVHYLNCAYMSPLMKSVEEAGKRGMELKRNPFVVTPNDFFEETELLREEFSKLIGSDEPFRSVIIPSVSYGMGIVARNLKLENHENIVVAGEQFPSNYYPWKSLTNRSGNLKVIDPPQTLKSRGRQWNQAILNAIDENTKMVAIGNVHWADGTVFDLRGIRQRTREVGALLVIDGTQSVGALPLRVSEIDPDALICAGYKWLMGPYSMGMAYFGEAFDKGIPLEENWINRLHSEDFKGLVNYEDQYHPKALRYEVGEHSNFILVPMMVEALKQLNQWGIENIQKYCTDLLSPYVDELEKLGYELEERSFRSDHLFGIRKPKLDIVSIQEALAQRKVFVSLRGDSIRISLNVFNVKEDMEELLNVLKGF